MFFGSFSSLFAFVPIWDMSFCYLSHPSFEGTGTCFSSFFSACGLGTFFGRRNSEVGEEARRRFCLPGWEVVAWLLCLAVCGVEGQEGGQ